MEQRCQGKCSTQTCPWGKEGNAGTNCMKPTEHCWDPSGNWLVAPCRRCLGPSRESPTEVIPTARGISRLRGYHDHDELTCGEFNLMICLVPSTQTNFLPVQAREHLWEASYGTHFLVWACPIHTCATHSLFPGNLDSNGIISP